MCASNRISGNNLVPLGNLVPNIELNIGQGIIKQSDQFFNPLDANFRARDGIVTYVICCHNFVSQAWISKFQQLIKLMYNDLVFF